MEPEIARKLIKDGISRFPEGQIWADLGAGGGLFTRTLFALLPPSSIVYAVDKEPPSFQTVDKRIHKVVSDFVTDNLDLPTLDGVLMANSLHYVEAKKPFLIKLREMMKPDGRLIFVEYDRQNANSWVPFPMPFADLTRVAAELSVKRVTKLAEHPSQYGGNLYSALVVL